MSDPTGTITRRQALVRAALLLGGALSHATIAGVLAGCEAPRGTSGGADWLPRTLSPQQSETVLLMGEHILPETDTPGARAAQVDRFIDAMLTDYYAEGERQRFLAGLERAEARARRVFGESFRALPAERQLELVRALNREAFREPAPRPPVPPEQGARPEDPAAGGRAGQPALQAADGDWDPADVGPGSFFRTLKELVLVGYYTSEVGATQELQVNPMGYWRADVPYSEIGQAWA